MFLNEVLFFPPKMYMELNLFLVSSSLNEFINSNFAFLCRKLGIQRNKIHYNDWLNLARCSLLYLSYLENFGISTYIITSPTNENSILYSSSIHTPCIVLSCQTTLTGIYVQCWSELFTAVMLITPHIKSFHLSTLSMFVRGFHRYLIFFIL